ncbi:AGE family epimerase/isomerase [Bifidobacterium choloepi]|uniref:AGE family epimerase/isomerase n=1 Tax=Bifidobacterium choloepi TaxID=2614131 RepID=A0A6I5N021_9BIFI|nr:AGE family epimerase/isomerase [Bifidobacterium choloepi]NEG69887.1 AGE family epimerase/isomerase [Bifidobacterium choloepi]
MMTEPKYTLGTPENAAFLNAGRDDLLDFGHRFPSPDGSSYWLGDDGTPWTDRNRATWITCRMTHVYALGTLLGHEGSEELVDAGLKGLRGALHDDANGGWYPEIRPEGGFEPTKQAYAHAFVLLAASSALLVGRPGAQELLDDAEETFLKRFWDDETGLSVDTWNTEFTELDPYRGLNANMHSVEAFLAVADVTGDEEWRRRAGRIIDHVIGWARENDWRIPEHFTSDWQADLEFNADKPDDQFKPYGATPGHGIEWARLITQWALSTFGFEESNDSSASFRTVIPAAAAEPYIDAAEHLFNRAVEDAWNADGEPGLVYTTDWNGKPVVHDRMHWTLAEGVNTASTLAHVTGKQQYADWYATFLEYIDRYLMDHERGSWFHQLDRNNNVIDTVWPGKSDLYHATQSMMIPLRDPSLSISVATKKSEGK